MENFDSKLTGIKRVKAIGAVLIVFIFILSAMTVPAHSQTLTGKQIVKKADDLLHGKSSIAEMTMTVVKPDWSRTMSMKAWMLEPEYALILITAPAKDKGTATLKRGNEIWNWVPSIERVIKIPPSMMMQPWMGSDFTNDDLVRESSIVKDYNHRLLGEEKISDYDCYKVELLPKPEAGVVWAKVLMWISKSDFLELRVEYYDENGTMVKYMLGSDVKDLGGRKIPAHWEMVPSDKPGEKTILNYDSLEFNVKINPAFFSEQNMKRVR